MNVSIELIEQLKAAYNLPSDYAASKKICVKPNSVSNWRHERSSMDDEIAINVAELLELDPLKVLASLHAERATRLNKESLADFWLKYTH
ncbi:hypothetical protein [Catenovulum agarivorans]|uniref:hypothetical protein n=1 Tax=Catenovulum agarivorans TaxID=1172192 RepID=UPI000307852A|nr:hypothetical protein [Catenovulum agarivorans]